MAIVLEPPQTAPRLFRAATASALAIAGIAAGLVLGALLVALLATRLFDYQVLTVRSESMAPAIRSGDLIVVKPVAIGEVAPGDVVLFASGGDAIPTVHRVAGINLVELEIRDSAGAHIETLTNPRLVTQGDANPLPDQGDVTAETLRGEVWFTVPNAGALVGLPIQYAFFALAGAALVAWAAWEVQTRRMV